MLHMRDKSKHAIVVASWRPVKPRAPAVLGRFSQKVEPERGRLGCRTVILGKWRGKTRKSEIMEIAEGTQKVCYCPGYAVGDWSRLPPVTLVGTIQSVLQNSPPHVR